MDPSPTLEVRRIIPAAAGRVFEAWIRPELLTAWFSPSADYAVIVHGADVRKGGRYRIEMRHKKGASHVAAGEYQEVTPPTRLAFTWKWEGSAMAETLVTVEFHSRGAASTEVVLTHTRFSSPAERDEHVKGWTGCLARLEEAAR